jgi:subtilisin family serine protease
MRKLLGAAVAGLLAVGVPAAAAHTIAARTTTASTAAAKPALRGELAETLQAAPAGAPLVVFVHGRDLGAARAAVTAAGLRAIKDFDTVGVVAAVGTPGQVRAVAGEPGVTYVEPDRQLSFTLDTAKEATRAEEATSRTYDVTTETPPSGSGKGCQKRNDKKPKPQCQPTSTTTSFGPFDGSGRSIAVIDTGVDGTHPMFQVDADGDPATPETTSKVVRNLRVICPLKANGELLVDEDALPADCNDDTTGPVSLVDVPGNDSDTSRLGGHGTHVASIAAGVAGTSADGRTVEGVATGSPIIALSVGVYDRVLGAGVALDWVVKNHRSPCGPDASPEACPPISVVNNSYGAAGEFDPEDLTSKLQRQLVGEGVVMVWANGNDGGTGAENMSSYAGQDPTPGVLTVANYSDLDRGTREGTLAPSSSRGKFGEPLTYPDLAAPGQSITAACRKALPICAASAEDSDYGTISGTSMAAPHVAGAVTILQEALEAAGAKDRSPAEIERILEDTAHRFAYAGPYEEDPSNSESPTSFDKGHGLLDVTAAVASVFGVDGSAPTEVEPCVAGAPTITDGSGDAVVKATGPTPDDDPALDVLAASLAGRVTPGTGTEAATREVVLQIQVADLEHSGGASRGDRYIGSFWVGAGGHSIDVQRLPGPELPLQFSPIVDGNAAGEATADLATDTITVTVPADAFSPPLSGVQTVDGFSIDTLSATSVAAGLYADEAATSCSGTIDTGAGPPPVVSFEGADGMVTTASPYGWTGTAPAPVNPTNDVTGDPLDAGTRDSQCLLEDDPRCDTERIGVDLEGASERLLRIVIEFPATEDYDAYLYGPDGELLAVAAESAPPEVFELKVRQSGVYRVAVGGFVTTGAEFTATATLT